MTVIANIEAWENRSNGRVPFYEGWKWLHTGWDPIGTSLQDNIGVGRWPGVEFYLTHWGPTILGFLIIALFGFTTEARETYKKYLWAALGRFGFRRQVKNHSQLSNIVFDNRHRSGDLSVCNK